MSGGNIPNVGEKKQPKLWGQTDRDKCSKERSDLAGLASLGQLAADTGSVLAADTAMLVFWRPHSEKLRR